MSGLINLLDYFYSVVYNRQLKNIFRLEMEWFQKGLKRKNVLPVDANGEPNWGFMEQYIKNIEQKKVIDYIAFASKKMNIKEYQN